VVIELPMSRIRLLSEEESAAQDKAEKEAFDAEMRASDEKREAAQSTEEVDDLTEPEMIPRINEDDEDYGLIPDELESEFERQARRTDRVVAGEPEDSIKMMEETELMDEMIESGTQTPLQEFLSDINLPSPAAISTDEEAEQALKLALTKLALVGVAFHVCEHYSGREAYRLFIEEVCVEAGHYRPLIGTGWVQNFCTSDYCKKCSGEDSV